MNLLHANDKAGQYPASYYAATAATLRPFPALQGATRADVCVVGGGYTGLSAALHLAKRGFDVVLLEAHRVGFGASGRNGGQVGSGQRQDQDLAGRLRGPRTGAPALGSGRRGKGAGQIADPRPCHAGDLSPRRRPCLLDRRRGARQPSPMPKSLRRDYGYAHIEPLDQTGIRRLIGSTAFKGGEIDRGRGACPPAELRHRPCRGGGQGGRAAARRLRGPAHRPRRQSRWSHTAQGTRDLRSGDSGRQRLSWRSGRPRSRPGSCRSTISSSRPNPWATGPRTSCAEPVAVADTKFVVNYWRLSEDNRLLFGGGETYGYRFPRHRENRDEADAGGLSATAKAPRSTTPGAARWRSP